MLCTINAICDYITDIIKRDGMNTNKHYYGDSRLNNYCAYCGGPAETEDHVRRGAFLTSLIHKICLSYLAVTNAIMSSPKTKNMSLVLLIA